MIPIGLKMGKVIEFPTVTEANKLVKELKAQEEEIKMCLDDLQAMNELIVDLTHEYEAILTRLCEINGVQLPEELFPPNKE